jgi:hypothetical protein
VIKSKELLAELSDIDGSWLHVRLIVNRLGITREMVDHLDTVNFPHPRIEIEQRAMNALSTLLTISEMKTMERRERILHHLENLDGNNEGEYDESESIGWEGEDDDDMTEIPLTFGDVAWLRSLVEEALK